MLSSHSIFPKYKNANFFFFQLSRNTINTRWDVDSFSDVTRSPLAASIALCPAVKPLSCVTNEPGELPILRSTGASDPSGRCQQPIRRTASGTQNIRGRTSSECSERMTSCSITSCQRRLGSSLVYWWTRETRKLSTKKILISSNHSRDQNSVNIMRIVGRDTWSFQVSWAVVTQWGVHSSSVRRVIFPRPSCWGNLRRLQESSR